MGDLSTNTRGGAWVAPKMVTPPLNLPAQAHYRTQGPAAHNMVLEHLFVEAGPAVTSVCIQGPAVARFELAPTLDLEAPVSARQELHPSGPLRSLRISGHLANSVYTQLHSALPVLGPSLKELRVCGVHQWSRVISCVISWVALGMCSLLLVFLLDNDDPAVIENDVF